MRLQARCRKPRKRRCNSIVARRSTRLSISSVHQNVHCCFASSYYPQLSPSFLLSESRSYAPGANWTYLCPPGCAAFASSAPIYGCSLQNVYDITSSVCLAALHQVRRKNHRSKGLSVSFMIRPRLRLIQIYVLYSTCPLAGIHHKHRRRTDPDLLGLTHYGVAALFVGSKWNCSENTAVRFRDCCCL
jgi:hypothetical protein